MIASEARISANRANALRSTGPTTSEGKERSRANSFKHGLTGAGVVLATEDAAEVERRFAGFQADFAPATDSGRCLVRRAAMLSVRLERCVVHEAAAISTGIRHAEADFDEAREAEVDHLMEAIGDEPAASVRRLRRMPEGVDRMVAAWLDLRSDLAHASGRVWTLDHQDRAEHLTGRRAGGFGTSRVEELSRAIRGDFALLGREDGAGLADGARRDWSRRQLVAVIDAEVAGLRTHRATLDLGAVEADRAGAADRAIFDPSKAATLARRYEAAAERMMYRALREMKQVEAANVGREVSAPAPPVGVSADPGRLGSFFPASEADPGPVAQPTPLPAKSTATASRPAAVGGYSMVPLSIGRAR